MIFAECDVCYSEKNRSIKKQEPKRLLIKIPIIDDMVFRWVADLGDIFSKSFFVFSLGLQMSQVKNHIKFSLRKLSNFFSIN